MKTIILAAGFGSRLWPLSTSERPKQFQNFINDSSLLQHTYALLGQATPVEDLYVLTLAGLEHLVFEQLPGISPSKVVIIPERRNTLPHTAYALNTLTLADDEPVLFAPVDHYFTNPGEFTSALKGAISGIGSATESTYLLCTKTEKIESSLGYLQMDGEGRVTRFIEKPDPKTIDSLTAVGNMYINTLRYITSKRAFTALLKSIGDENCQLASQVVNAAPEQLASCFLAMPMVDISHGVFEKASSLQAIATKGDFIDIGKFRTLYEINRKDQQGNAIIGPVILDGHSQGNFIINQLEQPLVLVNTHHSVVVQTSAGTIVSPMEDAEKIGEIYKTVIIGKSA